MNQSHLFGEGDFTYLCRASKEAKLAALGPFMNWGSGLPGIFGLEEVTTEGLGNPKGGIPAEAALTWAADKKAGCCKAINWAAMGFNPGGPPGGPNPFPANGFLSSRGSVILKNISSLRGNSKANTGTTGTLLYAKFKIGIQYPFLTAATAPYVYVYWKEWKKSS